MPEAPKLLRLAMPSISEIRKRAWQTRRAKYGKRGHSGGYCYDRKLGPCEHCKRMTELIVKLLDEGCASEGQAAKATGLLRVELRRRVDDLRNSRE